MPEILSLFLIGIALSMDAFSLSLAVGTVSLENKKQLSLSIIVGCFHFILPLLGVLIGSNLMRFLHISASLLVAGILLLIAFEMIHGVIKPSEKSFKFSIWGILLFAFSVSFDSFSVGLGLSFISSKIFLGSFIFAILSFGFTYLGLIIGRCAKKKLGVTSNIIGAILLIVVAILSLCK